VHAARCGGCPLIDLDYPEQLDAKRKRVADALAPYPALGGARTLPVERADVLVGYRVRAKLVVGANGELGLYARGGGHEVVDVPECQVLAPTLARVAAALRVRITAAARSGGVLAPATPEGPGALRAVDLREVQDGKGPPSALVTWVFDRERAPDRRALEDAAAALCRDLREVVGVAANLQRDGAAQVLGNETLHLAGSATAPDRVGASRHVATFGSFVQVHRGQAAKVHAAVADVVFRAGPSPRVLDLYGGSGAIALGLAARGARVRLIESFSPAVAQANEAARGQVLDVQAECADAGRGVEALAAKQVVFDAVVLNPPRRGASPAVREGLARLAPPVIVYVSCDPATLARDLDHFARVGYRTASVHPFDMIPLTDEVESVAVLERGAPPPPRVLYEDAAIVVVDKPPHEPVAPEPLAATCLTARVRSLPGAAGATCVLPLETDASGVVVFARAADDVAPWTRALASAAAESAFVVAVRGIVRAKGSVVRPTRRGRGAKPARVRYTRTEVVAGHSLLRVTSEGPASEAVRRNMAAIAHPVLGDEHEGDRATNRHFAEKAGLDRSFIHRAHVEVDSPNGAGRLAFDAPMAADLRGALDRYRAGVTSRP
jgi:23S rRNA (uracil1939-C5)-methyltransferase